MKFKRDAPRVLIGAIIVSVATLSVLSNRLFSGLTDAVEKQQFDLMRTTLTTALISAQDKALARADMLAHIPAIQAALAARDRPKLQAECAEMFAVEHEKYGMDQCQFHIPPAISFLRLHAPDRHGDDLSVFRPMVTSVNKDSVARKGLVIARTGPAIFGVAPIKDLAGAHTGSVDVGLDFAPILDGLKADYQIDLALFVDEEPLTKFAPDLAGKIATSENRRGRYIKMHSTQWALMQDLAQEKDLTRFDHTTFTRTVRGQTFGVVLIPLRNPAGEPLGILAAAQDFSPSRAASGRSLVLQVLLAIFTVVSLSGVVLIVIRGFISRPIQALNEGFAALAKGQPAPPAEDAETLCDEMRELAAHYEELRSKTGSEP